jgi:hypothetical protein
VEGPSPRNGREKSRTARKSPAPGTRATLFSLLRTVFVASGLVVAYYLLPLAERLTSGTITALVLGLLAVVLLFVLQIRAITRSPRPRLRAVEALATTLPLFLLLFAAAYYLLGRAEPESFTEPLTRTDSLYFALTVFSTVGFGDITARTETARVVTMVQMTGNLLLVGVAVRVVVGAVRTGLRQQKAEGP